MKEIDSLLLQKDLRIERLEKAIHAAILRLRKYMEEKPPDMEVNIAPLMVIETELYIILIEKGWSYRDNAAVVRGIEVGEQELKPTVIKTNTGYIQCNRCQKQTSVLILHKNTGLRLCRNCYFNEMTGEWE